jgi:hypothetical protein
MPCHHNLEEYLVACLDGAGLRDDPRGPLFRTIGRGTGKLTRTVLPQTNAYAMIRRRAAAAGIKTKLGNHSFRATGITACIKNGGTLEKAAAMANHASTQLYDRRRDEISLDDVERGIPSVIAAIIPDLRSVAVLLAPRGRLVCETLGKPPDFQGEWRSGPVHCLKPEAQASADAGRCRFFFARLGSPSPSRCGL